LADGQRRRVAGLRVVMSWPQTSYAAIPPKPPGRSRARAAGVVGVLLIVGGTAAVLVAVGAQRHAPQPPASAAGATGAAASDLSVQRSLPVSINIPAIGVTSKLQHLGLNSDGTIRVPSLNATPGQAAWYKYSATPGQVGVSVIEGHVDTHTGPGVFFRLGGLRPGDKVDVRLADGTVTVFRITGVRRYLKSKFPAKAIYAATRYAALRLITCGGDFDSATGHYLSSTVVFAALSSVR
jgi:Sortase domain